jgi:cytochrome c oxidase subunit 2
MKQLRHYIGTAIIVAGLTVGIGLWLQNVIARMPLGASYQAQVIEWLLGYHFWAIAFLFALIGGIMLYSILFFRQKKGEMKDGDHIEGNTPLEILWTVVPLGVVLWFSVLGGQTLEMISRPNPNALRVNVNGRQWSWSFEYPEYGVTSDVLVLPVDKQTLLRLRSADVIHSFWVPELGPKQDLLPGGEVRELRITPTETGEFKVRCAELCGKQHALMLADVIIMERAEFDAWIAMKIAEDPCVIGDQLGCGAKLAAEAGCQACHSLDGTDGVGPTWKGLFGSEHTHTDGSTTLVDTEHLLNAIRNPAEQILMKADGTEPYANAMPAGIAETLSDEQLDAIIAFIESLK